MSQWFDVRPSVLYENRYCNQNEFDIIINHERFKDKSSIDIIDKKENVDVKFKVNLIPILARLYDAKTAAICSNLFFLLDMIRKKERLSVLISVRVAPGKI